MWLDSYTSLPVFGARDGAQMEIRFLGQYSTDPVLCHQLSNGEDIHAQVAMELLGWSFKKAKEKQPRTLAKSIHFGVIYGLQWEDVWMQMRRSGMNISRERVRRAYHRYFQRYKKVDQWIHYAIEYARKHHRTLPTLYGMSRPLGEGRRDAYWENQARNSPIQGTAAQYLNLCLALVHRYPRRYALLHKGLVNEVHDRLDYICPLRQLPDADRQLQLLIDRHAYEESRRTFGINWKVSISSDASAGFRMGTMVDYDRRQSLETFVMSWARKNQAVEQQLIENPLQFIESGR